MAIVSEDQRTRIRKRLLAVSDNELLATLLTGDKWLEQRLDGLDRELAECQTIVTGVVLARLIDPDLLDRTFALIFADDEVNDFLASMQSPDDAGEETTDDAG